MNQSIELSRVTLRGMLLAVSLVGGVSSALADSKLWVTSDRLDRRTCPSVECGSVGHLMFREAVTVLEVKGKWSRISKFYSASCNAGQSDYVDKGNKACTKANGIVDGNFAEWVESKYLSANRPTDPGEGASGDAELVKGSDDFRLHQAMFAKAARELITAGTCTEGDFREIGGWTNSTTKGPNIYFTYCGGMTISNRIYLDVSTGQTFR
ncbi:hypothetical protein KW834_01810 [Pseudomonas sp. PDM29]|uniref:hypothetical protein n=1 Tax=Pseudomonas sp. PDM29 TaxID=2854771 RepID=UPI001C44EB8D|nr:hypothetical protein [Pseudomonas sp. PDM29]MBV7523149.1 hypothetical protein [Pseudomonas sp. PDM29]